MKTGKMAMIVLCAACMASLAFATETARVAKFLELEGSVEVKVAGGDWVPARLDMELRQGDMVRTKADSFAVVNIDGMAETATVEVKANSEMGFAELAANAKEKSQSTLLDLALGEVLIKAKKINSDKSRFEVKTPTSIVGVRGTTFSVTVEAQPEE